jgi:LPXTG-site transpeptidase (sortase) family protein
MRPRQPLDPGVLRGSTEDEVLRRFVATVRRWRGSGAAAERFRHDDLVVLVELLGTDAAAIERRLIALTGCDRTTARRVRRLLLVGLAALPVAPAALVDAPPGDHPAVVAAPAPAIEDLAFTPAAVLVSPTVAIPAPEVVATVPVPEAPTVDAGVHLSIPRLGIEASVVAGGQDAIDQGHVVHYWAPGWREPVGAGEPGTYWLAAHHETHGSPFLALPEVQVGDRIAVTTSTRISTYEVTSTEVVLDDAGFGPVYGTDPAAPRILLQTCLDEVHRLLVHGTLVPTS